MRMKVKMNVFKLRAAKASPVLLLGLGVVSTIAGVVVACKQTRKVDEVIDKHHEMMDEVEPEPVEMVNPTNDEVVEVTPKAQKIAVYIKTGWNFTKLYAAPAGLILLGMGSFLVSHRILNKRYLGAVAAYTGVSEAFQKYRNNVIEDQGKEKDAEYMLGKGTKKTIDMKTVDENGNETIEKSQGILMENGEQVNLSQFAICWASWTSDQWDENVYYNRSFLNGQKDMIDLMGHDEGFISNNDMRKALRYGEYKDGDFKVKQTDFGQHVGKVFRDPDDHFDMEIYERWIPREDGSYEPVYYIDFPDMEVIANHIDDICS